MNAKNPGKSILECLRKEQVCFKKLIAKLWEQKEAISAEDETRLLQIVEGKNVLIEEFQKIDGKIESQLQLLSPKEIERLAQEAEAMKADLEHALETIIGLEEECEKEIGLKMKQIKEKVQGLKKGKIIAKGYGLRPRVKPIISRNV
ncbi:MAG: hypothetical protein IID18_00285 [Nitrospinae bacterium]|nr:hypothetical protein [Nitrospinota bacterium]